ncbi:MAG: hypothetical protein IT548_06055 [Alphaproteobacteria bacterium]|nr:hypothetical protein [Alphaproteobacteria bacterium]
MADPRADMPSPAWAPRFLKIAAAIVAGAALLVAAINLVAFHFITQPAYATIAQLLDGYGRTYKPILHDTLQPKVVAFGASWVRDSFDAEVLSAQLGKPAFNHAVSGGQPYENRRFLESALAANPNIDTVILNVDSFLLRPHGIRFGYGFDESLLNVAPDGTPNRTVALSRAYAVTLSGAAIGANIDLLRTIVRLGSGETKEDVAPSYERRNFATARIRHPREPATTAMIDEAVAAFGAPVDERPFAELERALDAVCSRDITVALFFVPHLMSSEGSATIREKLAALAVLRARAPACRAKLSLYDFDYPNAVTLEDRTNPGLSLYWRPDGHPRPTVGQLMAARMFGTPFPAGTAPELPAEWGVELLRNPAAVDWLVQRARWQVQATGGT